MLRKLQNLLSETLGGDLAIPLLNFDADSKPLRVLRRPQSRSASHKRVENYPVLRLCLLETPPHHGQRLLSRVRQPFMVSRANRIRNLPSVAVYVSPSQLELRHRGRGVGFEPAQPTPTGRQKIHYFV